METSAYFDDIHTQIIRELKQAEKDITIAVAWFTDPDIFKILCQKASEGVSVKLALLDDEINNGSRLRYTLLEERGGEVFFIPQSESGNIMHHKFCVVDRDTVITGSFNWSIRARNNNEDIVVVSDAPEFAIEYLVNFNQILIRNGYKAKDIPRFDTGAIVKRLELINKLLELGDYDDVKPQLRKLRLIPMDDNLSAILGLLEKQEFETAAKRISIYIARLRAISVYRDPEIVKLKQELMFLEFQITAFSDRKAEMAFQINDFVSQHHQRLGSLLLRYQFLCSEKAKRRWEELRDDKKPDANKAEEEYSKSRDEYEKFRNQSEEMDKEEAPPVLSPEKKAELSRLYKKASMLCHPDRVTDERKKEAHAIFIELQNAYSSQDYEGVQDILNRLERGDYFPDPAVVLSEGEQLRKAISELQRKLQQLRNEINVIMAGETWRTICAAGDWSAYFNDKEAQLKAEIAELEKLVDYAKA